MKFWVSWMAPGRHGLPEIGAIVYHCTHDLPLSLKDIRLMSRNIKEDNELDKDVTIITWNVLADD